MLPKIPKGFVTNFPGVVPDFVGPRQFIFLLSIVSVLILTAFFLLTFQDPSQKRQEPQYFSFLNQMRQEAQLIQFSSSHLKNRYMDNLDTASKEKDSQKQFKALSANFNILSGMYSASHNPQLREKAQNLGNFITSVFPDKRGQFNVTCLDSSCGQLVYSPEEEEILALASEATFKDPRSKEELFRNMEAASAVDDADLSWQFHDSVFRIVEAEIKNSENSSDQLNTLGQKILEFIKNAHPEQYAHFEGLGLYKLD